MGCDCLTQGFDVVTCSRACSDCWGYGDCDDNGLNSTSPFALCSVGFASTHSLISEKEIFDSNVMILEVDDDDVEDDDVNAKENVENITDSNAMILDDDKAKEKVVNMNEVKTIAEAKFGGPKELAEEQKKRIPPQKKSNKKSKPAEKNVNSICLEQRDKVEHETSELFGYIRNLRGINSLRQKPSIIVTESPIKTVLSSYPNLQHSKKKPTIFKNLIDALVAAPPHSTVLVDMSCDLEKMIN